MAKSEIEKTLDDVNVHQIRMMDLLLKVHNTEGPIGCKKTFNRVVEKHAELCGVIANLRQRI